MFNFSSGSYNRPPNPYPALFDAFMNMFQRNEVPGETSELSQFVSPYDVTPQIHRKMKIAENTPETPQMSKKQGVLSQMTGNLMDILRNRESGNNYKAVNNLGYLGGYQFGAKALEDIGFLSKGASKAGNKALNNPKNWTIPGGRDAFLNNPTIQDSAMRKFMARNQQTLTKMGLIKENTPQHIINGMLAAAHLGGPGNVKNYLKGINFRDAYGTPVSEYFKMGMQAS